MKKEEVRAIIEATGIVPVVRAASAEKARFASEAVQLGGIPIVEITMTVPGAIEVIADLVKNVPGVLVGAGTVLDAETGLKCLVAGAKFLVSPGFDAGTVEMARKEGVLIMAGALTPTELMAAWKAGADFIKVFPCGNLGGANYIKALKGPFPNVPLVPTGGVNLKTAADYIRAGSAALGVGSELVLKEAIDKRDSGPIREVAKGLVAAVREARRPSGAPAEVAGRPA